MANIRATATLTRAARWARHRPHTDEWAAIFFWRLRGSRREALRILASLPDRQRLDLTLRVAGFSYVEIAAMTGGRTLTNVNKNLAKARARVRLERLVVQRSPT